MNSPMRSLEGCGLALAASLALAACGSGADEADGPAQSNQVLEGSINDDMIAFDTLESEPPPAKIEAKDGESASGSGGSSGLGESSGPRIADPAAGVLEADPSPAIEPTPQQPPAPPPED